MWHHSDKCCLDWGSELCTWVLSPMTICDGKPSLHVLYLAKDQRQLFSLSRYMRLTAFTSPSEHRPGNSQAI